MREYTGKYNLGTLADVQTTIQSEFKQWITYLNPTNFLAYCVCCWEAGAAGIRLENNTLLRGPNRGNTPEYQFKNIPLYPLFVFAL